MSDEIKVKKEDVQKAYLKKWKKENPFKVKEMSRKEYQKLRKESPWVLHYKYAKQRCHREYSDRGYMFTLSKESTKYLWFKYNAEKMKRPSIHRILNFLGYTVTNCMFIELSENIRLGLIGNKNGVGNKSKTDWRKHA